MVPMKLSSGVYFSISWEGVATTPLDVFQEIAWLDEGEELLRDLTRDSLNYS